jgi:hypothetical protein
MRSNYFNNEIPIIQIEIEYNSVQHSLSHNPKTIKKNATLKSGFVYELIKTKAMMRASIIE